MSADIAKAFNLDVQRGAFVSEVFPGSGSAKAGVKKDDIIIGLNGERVNCFAEFRKVLAATPAIIALQIIRGNESLYLLMR